MDRLRIVTALAREDHVAACEIIDLIRVEQHRLPIRKRRGRAAGVRGRIENHLVREREIVFLTHSVRQHGTDHAAPAHHT